MYGNPEIKSDSLSTIPHKFFERFIDNDLEDLVNFLQFQYKRIENGEMIKGSKNTETPWDSSNSETTIQWNKYNAFQFYHPSIHKLVSSVKSMTIEACDYYGVNYEEQQFMTQSWFNINYTKKGKLDWHDHGGGGAPFFHGYYCVNSEPSTTHYKVFDKEVENINKNNRAILSETGHPHAMADWDWDGPRITIAYDVAPLRNIINAPEQHWIPLL
jgi:hypothetical protein